MMVLATLLCTLAAAFDLQSISLTDPNADVFFAHADADGTADLFVRDRDLLTIFPSAHARTPRTIPLGDGVSMFDVGDLDGDGNPELVFFRGQQVCMAPLSPQESVSPTQVLFETDSLPAASGEPQRRVLVVNRREQQVIALFRAEALEFVSPDGQVIERLEPSTTEDRQTTRSNPFHATAQQSPQPGFPHALEMRIRRVDGFPPDLLDSLLPGNGTTSTPAWHATYAQARDAASREPATWPWIPLQAGSTDLRILFALSAPDLRATVVRVQEFIRTDDGNVENVKLGPPRRYPGIPVLTNDTPPDFNADGYADILLWHAPQPGRSMDALNRALSMQTWSLRLAAHVYLPDRRRYDPHPLGLIDTQLPLGWFLNPRSGVPLTHRLLRDLNGDGATDLALATGEAEFSIWLFDDGFSSEPDFRQRFATPITAIPLHADLDGTGNTAIILAAPNAYHILYPRP